jgi:hypothetical protein
MNTLTALTAVIALIAGMVRRQRRKFNEQKRFDEQQCGTRDRHRQVLHQGRRRRVELPIRQHGVVQQGQVGQRDL